MRATLADPTRILTDDDIFLVPHPSIVRKTWERAVVADPMVPNEPTENMYEGSTSFDYVVLPVDPSNPIPLRIFTSVIPPHLVICSTARKLGQRWADLTGYEFDAMLRSLAALARASDFADSTPMPSFKTLDDIMWIHQTWTCGIYVPRSFKFPGVEPESPCLESEDKGYAYVVVKNFHEPQRRLLPCEGGAPDPDVPQIRMFPSASSAVSDDGDGTLSWDSHIPDADEPEEYAKASIARGDCAADAKWLKRMSIWVERTSGSDDEQLLVNDAQIEVDLKEQPRPATSLDLNKPDYLTRTHKKRRT
ncbi:hypothetical protein B0H10DRAFT_1983909 [Mycena sp. CBHHK59/15]|nr:hypothetical protein B0H10DRAFT_1983909 [Mycena sp. CBHHK59/15]